MKVPILILDLGGVLLRIEYRGFIHALGLDHSLDEFGLLRLVTADSRLYESGMISTGEFFRRLSQRLKVPYDEQRLHAAWRTILAGEIEGMRQLVETLSSRAPLYMLSNTNELHFEFAVKQFPIVSMFEHHFLSFKIGALKPSPQIYTHVVERLARPAEEMLFVDDLERNVEGARSVGMQSIRFKDANALRRELTERGFSVT